MIEPENVAISQVVIFQRKTDHHAFKRLGNMATRHMAKGLAQNLVYYARLLKAHPQTSVGGKATCCEMHANLDAPV